MTIAFNTLFERIGRAIKTADELMDAVSPDLTTNLRAFQDELDTEQHDFRQAVLGQLESRLDSALGAIGGQLSTLVATPMSNLIIETVDEDVPLSSKSIDDALTELIRQMKENGESVQATTISHTITYGRGGSSSGAHGDNGGDGVFVFCAVRGDGKTNEFTYGETIRATVTSANTSGTASWSIATEPSKTILHPLWPEGSGVTVSVTTNTAASNNRITTGDLEASSTLETDLPYAWVLEEGVFGTSVKITPVEIQTVTVNGTPTAGYYSLTFTDRFGSGHTTDLLAYNAAAGTVQAALRKLPYLENVTVSSTGVSPNLTHSVSFVGVPNPADLTYTSYLTGGTPTITVTTATAGSPYVVRGARCLEFVGDGAENTALLVPVSLSPRACYAMNLWASVDVAPAAGELEVALVDGVSGDVIEDDQGTENKFTVDLTTLTTDPEAHNDSFHTPLNLPRAVYLRVKLTTPLSAGTSLFMDELCLSPMTRLYSGGPYIAAFSGAYEFEEGDYAEINVTNSRDGLIHEWLNRLLSLAQKDILLPVSYTPTQDDSLAGATS
jgi:hypothetical protein